MTLRERPLTCPIEGIYFVDEVERARQTGFRSASTPHHLVHITLAGEVMQWADGRPCRFGAGDAIWYHEGESIEGEVLVAPWRFYTVGFSAPRLAPPPHEHRVQAAGVDTVDLASRLLACWKNDALSDLERALRATALLLELVLQLAPMHLLPSPAATYPVNARERWWAVEKRLRFRLDQPVTLDEIAAMAEMSPRTLNRACKAATGMSPVQRFREMRLSGARGLLQFTDLSVTEIALRSGYDRVQDFSRDIRRRYGETPRDIRRAGPDYHEVRWR